MAAFSKGHRKIGHVMENTSGIKTAKIVSAKFGFVVMVTFSLCFRRGRGGRRGGRGGSRGPVPTAEELDADLDAFVSKVRLVGRIT